MRSIVTLATAVSLCATVPGQAQELASRVARLPDGEIRLSYGARPGVCGDGRTFIGDTDAPEGLRVYWYGDEGFGSGTTARLRSDCLPGPVRVRLRKAGGQITEVRVFVAGAWRGEGQDLGTVAAADAATYLLGLARTAPGRASSAALLAASLADGVQLTTPLISLARDRALRPEVRERALRWLAEAAEREGAGETADRAAREIVSDAADVTAVRARAIRTLSVSEGNDAFLRGLYARLEVAALRDRVIRRLGETPSSANVAWLRARATDAGSPLSLRDRAIRVLGEDLGERDVLRQLYTQLNATELRERVIRVLGQEGDEATQRWLQGIVEDPAEPVALRDRALRMLAEAGGTDYVRATYPRLTDPALKDRALRLAAENGDRQSVAWLQGVAQDRSQSRDLRDRALRLWAEAGASTGDLAGFYDASDATTLRQRVIRLLAERADDAAIDKLIAVARTDPDQSLRRYAVRRLAETGSPKAKQFIEETVRR